MPKLFDCEDCETKVNVLTVHNNKLLCKNCVDFCSCSACIKQFILTYKPSEHDSDGLFNEDY